MGLLDTKPTLIALPKYHKLNIDSGPSFSELDKYRRLINLFLLIGGQTINITNLFFINFYFKLLYIPYNIYFNLFYYVILLNKIFSSIPYNFCLTIMLLIKIKI